MSETVHVYVDLDGEAHYAGRMWIHMSGRREAATFQYDDSWLSPTGTPAGRFCIPLISKGYGGFPVLGVFSGSRESIWGPA